MLKHMKNYIQLILLTAVLVTMPRLKAFSRPTFALLCTGILATPFEKTQDAQTKLGPVATASFTAAALYQGLWCFAHDDFAGLSPLCAGLACIPLIIGDRKLIIAGLRVAARMAKQSAELITQKISAATKWSTDKAYQAYYKASGKEYQEIQEMLQKTLTVAPANFF